MKAFNGKLLLTAGIILFQAALIACHKDDDQPEPSTGVQNLNTPLEIVASSSQQWTGVAVSANKRIFANYPNWSEDHTVSVVEITDTSRKVPYPDQAWNTWNSTLNPSEHFICVQSVFIDKQNFLWILDPANPQRNGEYQGVVTGGAKLVKIDLSTNQVVQKISFTQPVIEKNSYLNDVRIDEAARIAYITDSNEGAIVVVDLVSGKSWRALDQDPSTKSENEIIEVGDIVWRNKQGKLPQVHSDGIALSPDRSYLYWRPLTGKSLYRVQTSFLKDSTVKDSVISSHIEKLGSFPPSDGMISGPDGKLYLTSVEESAVRRYENGSTLIVTQSPDLKWPDSFSNGPDGYMYVTTSQIHIPHPAQPYRIYRFKY